MKIFKCDICGKELSGKEIILADDKVLCEQCNLIYKTCVTCVNKVKCNFNDIHDNIPKTIQKRLQDPLTGSIQIIEMVNMDRIRKHCPNCDCSVETNYNDNPFCMKNETNTCNNYKFGV